VPIATRRGSARRITAAVGERLGFDPFLRLTERREDPFGSLRVFLVIVTLGYRTLLLHAGAMRVTIW
jgi:hypothetical protein